FQQAMCTVDAISALHKESLWITHTRGQRARFVAGVTKCRKRLRDSRHLGAWGRGARKTTRKTTDSPSYLVSALKTQLGHVTASPPSLTHQAPTSA
ncbi:hypothetical protein X777_13321, partial [Ooceraea biroi]